MRKKYPKSQASKDKERARKKLYYIARKNGDENVAPLRVVKTIEVENFKNEKGEWAKTKKFGDVQHRSHSYEVWKRMINRCTPGSSMRRASRSYDGCTAHPDFLDFQKFVEWHIKQVGYGIPGYDIDKDILSEGPKVYGPDTCVLVPEALNSFFVVIMNNGVNRGFHFDKSKKKFRADMTINNKYVFIGRYESAELASAAYRAAKLSEIRRWVARIESGDFPVDHRVIEKLKELESEYV